MKTTVTDVVKLTKTVTDLTMCSTCGIRLDQNFDLTKYSDIKDMKKTHYYRVTTHHNDWGIESVDSYEYNEYCPNCFRKLWQIEYPEQKPNEPELMNFLFEEYRETGYVTIEAAVGQIDAAYDFDEVKRQRDATKKAAADSMFGQLNNIIENAIKDEDDRVTRICGNDDHQKQKTIIKIPPPCDATIAITEEERIVDYMENFPK